MSVDVHASQSNARKARFQGGEADRADFQVFDAWRTLRCRWLLILILAVVGAVLGLLASRLAVPMFSATATIEVNRQSDSPIGVSNLTATPQQFGSSEEMISTLLTQQAELQSARVGLAVIDQLHLAPVFLHPRKTNAQPPSGLLSHADQERVLAVFESRLKVSQVKDTKLIEVTFTDSDPQRAAEIANDVVNTYVTTYAQARSEASTRTAALLSAQLADLRGQLLASEQRVSDFKRQTGVLSTDTGAAQENSLNASADTVVANRYIELDRALTAAEIARVGSQAAQRDGGPLASATDSSLLIQLQQQRAQLMLQQAAGVNTYGSNSPKMKELNAELAEVDAELGTERQRLRIVTAEDLRRAQSNEEGLRALVKRQQAEVTQRTAGGDQLRLLEQEANSKHALYDELYAKLQEAAVSNAVRSSTTTLVDPARAPVLKSSPATMRNIATGFVTGGLLGIFLAFLFDYRVAPASREVLA